MAKPPGPCVQGIKNFAPEPYGNAISEIRSGRVIVINLEGGTRAFIPSLDSNWRRTRLFLLTPRNVSMDEYSSKE